MALAIDGTAGGQFSTTNTGTVTLTTTQANDVIVLMFYAQNTTHTNVLETVSSVTSAHLTWVKRKAYSWKLNTTNIYNDLEIWWANASAALTSEVITVTLTGPIDDAAYQAFGVSGCPTPSSPWDTNASLAGANNSWINNTGSATPLVVSAVSTTAASGLLVGCRATISSSTISNPAGTTAVRADQNNGGGSGFAFMGSFYQALASPLSSASFSTTTSATTTWGMIVDALSGVSAGPNTYDNSISLNSVARGTSSAANTLGASALFNTVAAVTVSPQLSVGVAAALAVVAALTPSNSLDAVGAITANAVARASSSGIGDLLGTTSLNVVAAMSGGGGKNVSETLAFDVVAAAVASLALEMNPLITLDAVAASTSAAQIDMNAAITINEVARLTHVGGKEIIETVALDISLDALAQAALDIQKSATFNVVAASESATTVTMSAAISLPAFTGMMFGVAGAEYSESLTFTATMSAALVETIGMQAAVDLAALLAARLRASAKQPIADISQLQGTYSISVDLSGVFDIDRDLDGTFDITIALDGRTLN